MGILSDDNTPLNHSWIGRVMVLMRRHTPFIIASLLCLPFLVLLMLHLIVGAMIVANDYSPYFFHPPYFIYMPYVLGTCWLAMSPIISLTLLCFVSTSVVMAWFQKGKTRFEIVFTGIYSVVVLLYFGCLVWFLSKPS